MDLRPIGDDPLSAEDLSLAFETSASAGLISRRELELTSNLLRLSQTESRELMIPRSKMVAIPAHASWGEVTAIFAQRPFTHYPVYADTIDDVEGILDVKRLLLAEDDDARRSWRSSVQPPVVLPESVAADVVLAAIQRRSTPMAILVDEHGGTAGLITLFDIVRFLTEEIPEEPGQEVRHLDSWDRHTPLVVSGLVPMSEFRHALEIETPESEAVTIAGFVTELRQQIPVVGDSVTFDGVVLTVLEMDHYRVARVRLEPVQGSGENSAPTSEQERSR
jgi:CBS domain containing-hemolysin-like protein